MPPIKINMNSNSDKLTSKSDYRFCIGNKKSGSFVGDVAGLNFSAYIPTYEDFSEVCLTSNCQNCIKDYIHWEQQETMNSFPYNIHLCFGMGRIHAFSKFATYDNSLKNCQTYQGRLLHEVEIKLVYNEVPLFIKDCQRLWLKGGIEGATSSEQSCPIADLHCNRTSMRNCISELSCNLCMIPSDLEVFFYGSLPKYSRKYILTQNGNKIGLIGDDEDSTLDFADYEWNLHSSHDGEDYWRPQFGGSLFPMGRKEWNSPFGNPLKLTFTTCKRGDFTCDDGQCLNYSNRCNGVSECDDGSDEDQCKVVEQKGLYLKNRAPPPRKNETMFQIYYYTVIYSINDITADEGTAIIDMLIVLFWYDPRLVFWNPRKQDDINCNEIWHPKLSMADDLFNGFQILFESYKELCQVKTGYLTEEERLIESNNDPYMGRFIDGENLLLAYMFSGLITVPCRFNFGKYPFGEQKCDLFFWEENAYLGDKYNMNRLSKSTTVTYYGRERLREFSYKDAIHNIQIGNMTVRIRVILNSLFGYHLLNSFVPSFLMSLICMATLFIPLAQFNERIMVSLTALLVLAALYTQTSSASVKTTYLKYLDLWYVVLIMFCFVTVIYHILLQRIENLKNDSNKEKNDGSENADNTSTDSTATEAEVETATIAVRVKNRIAKLVFVVWLFSFIIFYAMVANNVV